MTTIVTPGPFDPRIFDARIFDTERTTIIDDYADHITKPRTFSAQITTSGTPLTSNTQITKAA